MNAILDIVEARLPDVQAERPVFWSALTAAYDSEPPPYGEGWYGDLFRDYAQRSQWLADILVLNAKKEADGARQLWAFAGRIADRSIKDRVKQHAIDEARHARFYISMLGLMFPESSTPEILRELRTVAPDFMMADEPAEGEPVSQEAMLDEIIQMNIGEIRTLINQMLMRPVVAAVTDDANRDKAVRLLDSLGDDEARHISYTADIIDEIGDRAMSVHYMTLRQREFNGITTSELGLGSDRAPIFE